MKKSVAKLGERLVIISTATSTEFHVEPGKALSRSRRPKNRVIPTWYCANSWEDIDEKNSIRMKAS